MANKSDSLAHTKWLCKYHIVFAPKYRRKVIYNQIRKDIGEILRELCRYKGVELLEGHMMPDRIPEGEERANDIRTARKSEVQIWEPALLVRRILCKHGRAK